MATENKYFFGMPVSAMDNKQKNTSILNRKDDA